MEICHEHNLLRDLKSPRPYGIRVTLSQQDSFATVLLTDCERLHLFQTS